MQLHSPLSNYMYSAHIAKHDRTLNVPDCTTCFQALAASHTLFAANALSRPFILGVFHFFLRLSLRWPFRCSGSFAAVALSLQWLFRCRTSFALDTAGLSKRRNWFFQVDHCSDAASLLHPAAATFTTLGQWSQPSHPSQGRTETAQSS